MKAWLLLSYDPDTEQATHACAFLVADADDAHVAQIHGTDWATWIELVGQARQRPDGLTEANAGEFLDQVCNGIALAANPISPDDYDPTDPRVVVASELLEGWASSLRD